MTDFSQRTIRIELIDTIDEEKGCLLDRKERATPRMPDHVFFTDLDGTLLDHATYE
jgi:hypothetical protein